MKISFLYLNAFSDIGGIQTFNRNFLRACNELANENFSFHAYSLKDKKPDLTPFENIPKDTAEGNKMSFLIKSFFACHGIDKIILAHFNLLFPLAIFLRIFSPRSEIILVAHGIEAWKPLSFLKKISLRSCHHILAVSSFTKEKLVSIHRVNPDRVHIFPNTLDPEFPLSEDWQTPVNVFEKHKINKNDRIIFTLCRLSTLEKRKGYEIIIRLLPKLIKLHPGIRYILAGKEEDQAELKRITQLVSELNLQEHVILPGYLSPEELPAYYAACTLFVMPSTKEGFGIVFLEALAFGKPVIAGNQDGSKDALQNGKLGILVNPHNEEDILQAISNVLSGKKENYINTNYLKTESEKAFGFAAFRERTRALFSTEASPVIKPQPKQAMYSEVND